jgi:hypothetical protein
MFSVKHKDPDTGNTLLVCHTALLCCPSTPPPAGSLLCIKSELNPSPSSIPVPWFKQRQGGELVALYIFQAPPLVQASGVKTEHDNVTLGKFIKSNHFLEQANPCARQLWRPGDGQHKQHWQRLGCWFNQLGPGGTGHHWEYWSWVWYNKQRLGGIGTVDTALLEDSEPLAMFNLVEIEVSYISGSASLQGLTNLLNRLISTKSTPFLLPLPFHNTLPWLASSQQMQRSA